MLFKPPMRCITRIIAYLAHIKQGFWAIFGILGIGVWQVI